MMRWVLVIIVLLAGALAAVSQEPVDTVDVDAILEGFELDIPAEAPEESELKSPMLALTLSAIMPGAGQIYNGSYWKVPIIFGFAGYFTYAIVVLQDFYSDYRQRFRDSINEENPMGNSQLRFIRDFYRDQRDRFAWYLGFLYLINLLDAYVEATLTGFDVGEDLMVRMMPYVEFNGTAGLQVRVNF